MVDAPEASVRLDVRRAKAQFALVGYACAIPIVPLGDDQENGADSLQPSAHSLLAAFRSV